MKLLVMEDVVAGNQQSLNGTGQFFLNNCFNKKGEQVAHYVALNVYYLNIMSLQLNNSCHVDCSQAGLGLELYFSERQLSPVN